MSIPYPRERPRRVHGLQLPLHPLQVTGWAVLAALATGTYFLLLPPLGWTRLPVAIALAALLLLHVISHLAAAFVDPAEQEVRAKTSRQVGVLDRKKHRHVIEEGHCYLCCITTSGPRTKHCQACNKCVARFDHHCKWLNQCIGGRNYLPFFMCVSSAMAAALLVAAVAVADLFLYHFRPEWFHQDSTNTTDDTVNGQNRQHYHQVASTLPTSDAAFLAIVGGLGLLAAVTAGLLLHLCFFHIYISFLGLTTYEYIRQQRQTQPVTRTAAIPNGTANGDDSQEKCHPRLKGRPIDLSCNGGRTRTTMFTCTFIQEENICSRPTATPPCTPTGCTTCKNEVAPELPSKANGAHTQTPSRKVKRRWNCCMSVPDSPDDVDPRCLMSLCRHKTKAKPKPKPTSPIDGRTPRTHGHWSRVKLRVLFRVLGYLGHHRRRSQTHLSQAPASVKTNQVAPSVTPTVAPETTSIPTVHSIVPMPALPPPRRRLVSEAELAAALSILQQQQPLRPSLDRRRVVNRRSRRRSATHRTKSPTLSPIRESGLSNPASPSRQTCGMPLTCSPRQF